MPSAIWGRQASLAFLMSLRCVLFHDSTGRNFLRPLSIAAGRFRGFLDMFVLTLFLCTDASEVLFFRHKTSLASHFSMGSMPDSLKSSASTNGILFASNK